MKTAAALIFTFVFSLSMAGLEADLEHALARHYEKKILILRHPVRNDSQKYNAAGELLNGGSEAPWTVNGAIEVHKIHLTPTKLRIEGKRRVYGFDARQNKLIPFNVKDKPAVNLEIALDAPLSTLDQGDAIIHRVFNISDEELINSAPEFWRPFLTKQYGNPKIAYPNLASSDSTPSAAPTAPPPANDEVLPAKIDNKTVKPPKPISTLEPSFSDAARHFRYQGTMILALVVDKEGKIRRTQIVRPLGFGLDEQAIAAVQTWKFQPATRNGEPVAVEMGVEISFKLF